MIALTWDSSALKRFDRVPSALATALRRAGTDAVRAMKSEASRQVRSKKRFKVSVVNKGLPLTYPTSRNIDSLVWTMRVSGAPQPAIQFAARQTKAGVSFGVNTGKRSFIKSAFIATMRSGHVGVFYRQGTKRLPIDEAFTTRISDVFSDSGVIPAIQARTQSVFAQAFFRSLPGELRK